VSVQRHDMRVVYRDFPPRSRVDAFLTVLMNALFVRGRWHADHWPKRTYRQMRTGRP
jgi:hypothetical protein